MNCFGCAKPHFIHKIITISNLRNIDSMKPVPKRKESFLQQEKDFLFRLKIRT
jgi:hypothetical protein